MRSSVATWMSRCALFWTTSVGPYLVYLTTAADPYAPYRGIVVGLYMVYLMTGSTRPTS